MAQPPKSTQPAKQEAEADRVEDVYKWAISMVGVAVVAQALAAWSATGQVASDASLAAMQRTVATAIKQQRQWLYMLAMAYYRLVSALRTGTTVSSPYGSNTRVTVETLRREFEAVVDEIEKHRGVKRPPAVNPSTGGEVFDPSTPRPELPKSGPEDRILLEVRPSPIDVRATVREIEADAEQQLVEQFEIEKKKHRKQSDKIKKKKRKADKPDAEVIDLEAERKKRGERLAAIADRISRLAARGLTYSLAQYDGKVYGWIRYSRTGTPCGWCAMLMSRGFVQKAGGGTSSLFRAKETASKFHENCQCVAVPVFTSYQIQTSDLFALNRQYAEEWPRVTRGLSGKEAMSAWRTHIGRDYTTPKKKTALVAA